MWGADATYVPSASAVGPKTGRNALADSRGSEDTPIPTDQGARPFGKPVNRSFIFWRCEIRLLLATPGVRLVDLGPSIDAIGHGPWSHPAEQAPVRDLTVLVCRAPSGKAVSDSVSCKSR